MITPIPLSTPKPQPAPLEAFTQAHQAEDTRAALLLTERIVHDVARALRPGMTERDGLDEAKRVLAEYRAQGFVKQWHPPRVYFGVNTATSVYATTKVAGEQTLGDVDIAFVDLAPVFVLPSGREVEGDIGRTLVFGDDPALRALRQASEDIFAEAAAYFRANRPTGAALYQFVRQRTHARDLEYRIERAGHIIGAFPHHHAWRGSLDVFEHVPEPDMWILEVQVWHRALPYAAFYEDLLR